MAVGNFPLVGSALTQPQVPVPGTPPMSAEQPGLWGRFQERLKQDPNLRLALLTTGLNLLKSPQPGQGGFDVFSNAALTGVGTLDQLRQREAMQAAQGREEERANRRLDIIDESAETRKDQGERRLTQSDEQFSENLKVAQDKLAEDKRQFNERMSVGGFNSQSTGAERAAQSAIDALVLAQPEIYPDTPEGRAKARLRVQGIEGVKEPLGQARIIAGLISDLTQQNIFADNPLPEEKITQRAMDIFQTISGVGEPESEAAPPEDLDGKTLELGGQTLTVVSVGDGKYKLKNVNGVLSQETYTQAEIEAGSNQ